MMTTLEHTSMLDITENFFYSCLLEMGYGFDFSIYQRAFNIIVPRFAVRQGYKLQTTRFLVSFFGEVIDKKTAPYNLSSSETHEECHIFFEPFFSQAEMKFKQQGLLHIVQTYVQKEATQDNFLFVFIPQNVSETFHTRKVKATDFQKTLQFDANALTALH